MVHAAALAGLLAVARPGSGWAATYTVTNTDDHGRGSLRWAIGKVNAGSGGDTILFSPSLENQTITPASPLPYIAAPNTEVNGDFGADGTPGVTINGRRLPREFAGLSVNAPGCLVHGLSIINCEIGLVWNAGPGRVHSCHFGVDVTGTTRRPNQCDLMICIGNEGGEMVVGSTAAAQRNVFACGGTGPYATGVRLVCSLETTIVGNYFGLSRDGLAVLGSGGTGVRSESAGGRDRVGGATGRERNVFAGVYVGVDIWTAGNVISGNWFGLAADGSTALGIGSVGVLVSGGDNIVGGTTPGARNVFIGNATTEAGVWFQDYASGNRVQGNYFGLDASGGAQRLLPRGVWVSGGGPEIIGGSAAARNYFAPSTSDGTGVGVQLDGGGGTAVVVRNNWFGLKPDGQAVPGMENGCAVKVNGVDTDVVSNTIAGAAAGVLVSGASGNVDGFRNTIRDCGQAVHVADGAHCLLGNLGNRGTHDDGNNTFDPTNVWFVYNETARAIKAEGNSFGTTSRDAINAKMWDNRDDPSLGAVDFDPLQGGVHPTGGGGMVVVSGMTAVPAGGGAEIVFSLSGPAEVTVEVFNVAGRPVATVARHRVAASGTSRLLWGGRTVQGTRAPAGVYLVRLCAATEDGQTARGLATLRLQR